MPAAYIAFLKQADISDIETNCELEKEREYDTNKKGAANENHHPYHRLFAVTGGAQSSANKTRITLYQGR
jgi:hypothetical protein